MSRLESIAAGPNIELIGKLRDVAAIMNQMGGMTKQNQEIRGSELNWVKDSIQYGPPYKNRPTDRAPKAITSEHSDMAVSPILTGLHDKDKRRSQRAGSANPVGSDQAFAGGWGHGVGAHIT